MYEPINALRPQWKTSKVEGKPDEPIVLTRVEKSNLQSNYNWVRKGVVKRKTTRDFGDIVKIDNNKYFVVGKQATEVKLIEANTTISIQKLTPQYINGVNTNKFIPTNLYTNIPTFYEDISGNMRLYDQGLLPTSVKKFIVESHADIKLTQRIKLGDKNFQINDINTTRYPGLLFVQVENDTRVAV